MILQKLMVQLLNLSIVLLLVHLVSQDLSVAGKRAGLSGERSGLFMEAVRVIKEMRKHEYKRLRSDGSDEFVRLPQFCIWENVPGALSSNNGEDFRVVLEELAHIKEPNLTIPKCEKKWGGAGLITGDDWSIAWRVFDAQYWGVPQRRKRIALVMDFAGGRAGEILFESEGLQGNLEQGIKTWKNVARSPEIGIGNGDCNADLLKLRHTGSDTQGGGGGSSYTAQFECDTIMQSGSDTFLTDRKSQ